MLTSERVAAAMTSFIFSVIVDASRLLEVVDVVVDALAEEDDGLAAAADAADPVGDLRDGLERHARVVAALHVERIVDCW